ncbi:MAG TPA: MFS transporter [Stellaceae bacterium]|nr:MFS transporter [Stellaceae bacterium]
MIGVLRTNAAFRRYWMGQTVSIFGDQISRIGIPLIAVASLQAGATQMGVLSSAGQASLLIFGLLAGAWVDRVRRRRLLIGCDLARAVVIATIPGAAALGELSVPFLTAVAFAIGSLSVVFGTAIVAFLPSLSRPDELIECNARLTQTVAVAQIAGPGLGGVIIETLTAPFAIVVDAISYLVSAAFLTRLGDVEEARSSTQHRSVRASISEGVTYVRRQPLLRSSAGCAGTYNFFNAAILALQVFYLSRTLGLRPTSLGLVLGAIGPGALLGAAVAVRMSGRCGVGRTMVGGLVLAGTANFGVAVVVGSGPVVVLTLMGAMFLNGLGQPLYNINQASLRQAVVPDVMRGRVTATLSVLAGGAGPVGALAAGGCAAMLGIRATLIGAAAGTALSCLWLLLSPIRALDVLPAPSTVEPQALRN